MFYLLTTFGRDGVKKAGGRISHQTKLEQVKTSKQTNKTQKNYSKDLQKTLMFLLFNLHKLLVLICTSSCSCSAGCRSHHEGPLFAHFIHDHLQEFAMLKMSLHNFYPDEPEQFKHHVLPFNKAHRASVSLPSESEHLLTAR